MRSDLELAFPFEDAWRLAWLSGAQLRAGLERAARKSAERDCQSALQVAGMRLRIRCDACRSGSEDCLEIEAPPGLVAEERLLVALPSYLTQSGADFEHAAPRSSPLEVSLVDELARSFAASSPVRDMEACARDLQQLSSSRCAEGFGALACPLGAEAAAAACRNLREPSGGRDGRIELLP